MRQNKNTNVRSSKRLFTLLAPALGAWFVLAGAGCGTSKPGSASFASVIIKGHSPEEITRVTAQVFQEAGYAGGSMKGRPFVFQKEASRATTMSREGLASTHYGAQSIDRVVVDIVALSGGQQRLQCKAYVVTGGSDPFFQEEVPLTNVRSGPYRSLLNKIAKQLN
jgi:hypothetical protein